MTTWFCSCGKTFSDRTEWQHSGGTAHRLTNYDPSVPWSPTPMGGELSQADAARQVVERHWPDQAILPRGAVKTVADAIGVPPKSASQHVRYMGRNGSTDRDGPSVPAEDRERIVAEEKARLHAAYVERYGE